MQPPNSILIGPTGSGKTFSIATQLLGGLEVFVVITEPSGLDSLLDACEKLKAPIDKLHWCQCNPAAAGWSGLEEMITKINTMDQKGLADIRDMGKADFRSAAMELLNAFRDFPCDRTQKNYGDMASWDDTRSMNIDSLTGFSAIAWGATVGYKPTANPGEWGIAQNFIFNFLMKINSDRKCFFTMTAHMEKEMDDNTGVRRLMVSTIGAKLAPKIPTFFSEVIRCSREMDAKTGNAKFRWSTIAPDIDLKNRALPISNDLQPDFRQIIDAYKRRKNLAGVSSPTTANVLPLTGAKT